MSYQVIEKYQTASGKWQVRVVIDDTQSTFLNFQTDPTQADVDREAEAFAISQRLNELKNTPVDIVQQEIPSTRLTKLDYMNRFTDAELATIYATAKQSPAVEVWLEKFKLSEFVDTADPRTVAGVQALESAGLIAAGRANEILA